MSKPSRGNRNSIEVRMELPKDLAQEAESGGLLTPKILESLLRSELRRRRAKAFSETIERIAKVAGPPMTENEINAEIQAARALRRKANAGSS